MQIEAPVDPFGEINLYPLPSGKQKVVATLLLNPDIEGAATGLALDASASMKKMYGISPFASGPFKTAKIENVMEPVAQSMASFLAGYSSENKVHLLYWALSPDGSQIQPIGAYTPEQADVLIFNGPANNTWGRGTKLLPPLKYFCEEAFPRAKWAICVFLTDGIIEDLYEVKEYSRLLARKIAKGQRNQIKFVLLGIGSEVDESQMTELDDMFEENPVLLPNGESIDLWDHKLAANLRQLSEIFAEVVSEDMKVGTWGKIWAEDGRLVCEFRDGIPARFSFEIPATHRSFRLEFSDGVITQPLPTLS